jgi:hypothetical protein
MQGGFEESQPPIGQHSDGRIQNCAETATFRDGCHGGCNQGTGELARRSSGRWDTRYLIVFTGIGTTVKLSGIYGKHHTCFQRFMR